MSVVDHGLRTPISRSIRLLLLATVFATAAVLFAAANASAAIGVSSFSLTPSTTTQGANPNLAISATRSGSSSDDLKTATLKLPAGLNYSLAGAAKCTSSAFAQDSCPAGSVLGSATLGGTVSFFGFNLLSGSAGGTVYALSATQFGVIYRPSGIPKILVKTAISGTVSGGLTLASGDYPRKTLLFGLFPVDLTISGGGYALSGKSVSGAAVITNPTTCGSASSSLTFLAYNGTSGSKSSSFSVTGCTGPTGPTGEPTGPTGEPTGPTGEPTGPTGEPTGPTGPPADTIPPVISITAPADNSSTTDASTTLTYSATDNSGAAPTCDKASGSSQPLALGANTITVTCHDAANNSSSATVHVTRTAPADTTPPVVTITAPVDNSQTTDASTTLTYSATDNSGATPVCDKASGSSQPLALGANTITVTCHDAANNSASAVVHVTRSAPADTIPPVVTITAPVDNSQTTDATTTLTYTASDDSGAAPVCDKASGSSQPLAVGPNTITVTCHDAANNSASATVHVTRTAPADTTPPVVTITAPADNSSTTESSVVLTFTATDNSGDEPTCDKSSGGVEPLALGANTITVTCHDAANNSTSATVHVTRNAPADTTPPVVTITAPVDNSSTTASSATLTYTASDDSGDAPTCDKASGSSQPLVVGPNTITVTCNDAANNSTTATVHVTRNDVVLPPGLTVTSFAPPSTNGTSPHSVTFSATPAPTSYSCRSGFGSGASAVSSAAFTACTSPWAVAIPSGITDGTNIEYEIKATNGGGDSNVVKGFTWYDTRAFTAVPAVAPHGNSLVTEANAANAGAHPDVTASLAVRGYDDGKTVTITFPDGLMGSLASIPKASRCTPDQATAGTCPLSAKVGDATGTATSATDGTVTSTGTLYLVDANPASGTQLDPKYAAGVALSMKNITGPISGNLGDVNAQGFLAINDAARNIKVQIDDVPNQTSTGNAFHIQSASLTMKGDTGGASAPLVTNPHFCGPFNPNRKSPGGATANNFYGSGTSYQGHTTPEISAPYNVVNCAALPFNPTMSIGITHPAAGGSTPVNVSMSLPAESSTIRTAIVKLPPFIAPNFPAFGGLSDQCSSGAYNSVAGTGSYITSASAFGTAAAAYREFTTANCPPQAIIGQATLSSPLLPQSLIADVYLSGSSPIPALGIYVDPTKHGNLPGIRIGLYSLNATTQVDPACDPATSDTGDCPTQIQATVSSTPDVPVSSLDMRLGGETGRALGEDAVVIASPSDPACVNAGSNWSAALNSWSSTTNIARSGLITPTGCNQ